LKHTLLSRLDNKRKVEERVPGKQGLKQIDEITCKKDRRSRRASSRKTRIETPAGELLEMPFSVEERVPGKQGLKLIV